MQIADRVSLWGGKRLPFDSEVEYLGSTRTQYIDTGYVPATTFAFELTYSLASVGTSANMVFGFGGGGNGVLANLRSSAQFAYGGVFQNINLSTLGLNNTSVHTIRGAEGKFYFDGVLGFTGDTTFVNSRTFWLFGRNSGTIALGSIRICGCKIYDANGILIRDFIPVRVGTVGALYDRRGVGGMNGDGTARNDGLYFNRGTDEFIIGPDKN